MDDMEDELEQDIADLDAAYKAADVTLQSNITAEASTRLANDNTLQANINSEEAARISADTTLQANIDSEETARIAGDAALSTSLGIETANRGTAVANLQSQIDNILSNVDPSALDSLTKLLLLSKLLIVILRPLLTLH